MAVEDSEDGMTGGGRRLVGAEGLQGGVETWGSSFGKEGQAVCQKLE